MLFRWLPTFIFGLWPFLYHLAFSPEAWANIGPIAAIGLIWLAALLALAALIETKFPTALRSPIAAALATLAVLLFCYGLLEEAIFEYLIFWLPLRYKLGIWLLLLLAAAALAYRFGKRPLFMRLLSGLSVLAILVPLGTLVRDLASQPPSSGQGGFGAAMAQHKNRPNVYFFVFDAYGRADQLKDSFGFDNGPFTLFLENRGFQVQTASNTNYPISDSAFTAVLTMQYHDELERFRQPWPWKLGLWKSAVLKGNGPVARKFRSMGYRYVHGEGAYASSRCGGLEELCIRGKQLGLLNNNLISLFEMTPAISMIRSVDPGLLVFEGIEFDQIVQAIPKFPASPVFTYAHIFMPHDADRFPDCSKRPPKLVGLDASLDNDPVPYLDTIRCINGQIRKMLPHLLAADPSAIVIFQSDHGFVVNSKPSIAAFTETDINRRYGNLSAMRLPGRCQAMVGETMTPVNTFRIVFACLERRAADLLPDKSYAIWYYDKTPPRLLRTY